MGKKYIIILIFTLGLYSCDDNVDAEITPDLNEFFLSKVKNNTVIGGSLVSYDEELNQMEAYLRFTEVKGDYCQLIIKSSTNYSISDTITFREFKAANEDAYYTFSDEGNYVFYYYPTFDFFQISSSGNYGGKWFAFNSSEGSINNPISSYQDLKVYEGEYQFSYSSGEVLRIKLTFNQAGKNFDFSVYDDTSQKWYVREDQTIFFDKLIKAENGSYLLHDQFDIYTTLILKNGDEMIWVEPVEGYVHTYNKTK